MYSHKTLYLKTFDISWCILNVMFEFCVETKIGSARNNFQGYYLAEC